MSKTARNLRFELTEQNINKALKQLEYRSRQMNDAEAFAIELCHEYHAVINALFDFNRDASLAIRKALADDLFTLKEVLMTLDENEFRTLRDRLNVYKVATIQLEQGFTEEEAVSLSRLFHRLQNIVVMKLEKLIQSKAD